MAVSKNTFTFLKELKENNNREWFAEHKSDYKSSLEEFEIITENIISEITKFDSRIENVSAKDCIFRIYKDIRFSKDKTPYKTHLGAYITPGGRKASRAGYYIHIEPGEKTIYAGGLHGAETSKLAMVRAKIANHHTELEEILMEAKFKKHYKELDKDDGDILKTVPRGYKKDHPAAHLLRYKNHIVTHTISDNDAMSNKFIPKTISGFKAVYPLVEYLNSAMD